jgi:hypothetical protein
MNIGAWVGYHLPFHPTPGFNLARGSANDPYIAASHTNNVIGIGGNAATLADQARATASKPSSPKQPAATNYPQVVKGDQTTTYQQQQDAAARAQAAQDAQQYGYYTGLANDTRGRLDNAFNAQKGNINHQYDVSRNEYNSAKTAADQSLAQQLQGAKGQFLTHQNQINENARQTQQSLLRQLGILGAGGGSAALFAIPNAVRLQTNQALSGAGQDYAQNADTANTAYNNYINTQYNPGIQKLEDFKQNQLNQTQADYNQNHEGLLRVLQGLQNHSANAETLGGQVLNYQSNIPNLIQPAANYNGQIAQYQAPTLNSYEQQVLPQAQVQGPQQGASPQSYLALLAGQQKKRTNQLI